MRSDSKHSTTVTNGCQYLWPDITVNIPGLIYRFGVKMCENVQNCQTFPRVPHPTELSICTATILPNPESLYDTNATELRTALKVVNLTRPISAAKFLHMDQSISNLSRAQIRGPFEHPGTLQSLFLPIIVLKHGPNPSTTEAAGVPIRARCHCVAGPIMTQWGVVHQRRLIMRRFVAWPHFSHLGAHSICQSSAIPLLRQLRTPVHANRHPTPDRAFWLPVCCPFVVLLVTWAPMEPLLGLLEEGGLGVGLCLIRHSTRTQWLKGPCCVVVCLLK